MGEPVLRMFEPWPLRTELVGYCYHADFLPASSDRLRPEDMLWTA